jgi:hypothetical protein
MILTGQGILKSEEGLNSSLYVWLKEENTHCSRPPPSPSPFLLLNAHSVNPCTCLVRLAINRRAYDAWALVTGTHTTLYLLFFFLMK